MSRDADDKSELQKSLTEPSPLSAATEGTASDTRTGTADDTATPLVSWNPQEILGEWQKATDSATQLGEGAKKTAEKFVKDVLAPDPDKKLHVDDDIAAFYAAHLDKYNLNPLIISALTRNEIEHRKPLVDDAQDAWVQSMFPRMDGTSIGNQQIQIANIKRLTEAKDASGKSLYPQLEALGDDPAKAALDPKNGALLLGAYLQDVAARLDRNLDPVPEYDKAHAAEVKKTISELWATKDPEKRMWALIRSYNPGDGQTHVNNVLKHLEVIKKTHPIDPAKSSPSPAPKK